MKMQLQILIKSIQLIMVIIAVVLLVSCQKEFDNATEPDKSTSITENDNVADLIIKVVLKDGSFDNIIDKCSEISIKFPYSIRVKGENITIQSLEDIDKLKQNHFLNRNHVTINYPVTAIHSNYSEEILSNEGELKRIQNEHNQNLNDEDIESVDFVYPITLSIYNVEFQKTDQVVATNDEEMYRVFSDLSELIVEINYPIDVKNAAGETSTINDNYELEVEIADADKDYDENDDPEIDEEDVPLESLITGGWNISLLSDTEDRTDAVRPYKLIFKGNHALEAKFKDKHIDGTWKLDVSDEYKILSIKLDTDDAPLTRLNEDWEITEYSFSVLEFQVKTESNGMKKLNLSWTE